MHTHAADPSGAQHPTPEGSERTGSCVWSRVGFVLTRVLGIQMDWEIEENTGPGQTEDPVLKARVWFPSGCPLDYGPCGIQWGLLMKGHWVPCLRLSDLEPCGQQEGS